MRTCGYLPWKAQGYYTPIGRHLSQIARMLNQGGRAAGLGRQEVQAMLKVSTG